MEENRRGLNTQPKKMVNKTLKAYIFRTAQHQRSKASASQFEAISKEVLANFVLVISLGKVIADHSDLLSLRVQKRVKIHRMYSSTFRVGVPKRIAVHNGVSETESSSNYMYYQKTGYKCALMNSQIAIAEG